MRPLASLGTVLIIFVGSTTQKGGQSGMTACSADSVIIGAYACAALAAQYRPPEKAPSSSAVEVDAGPRSPSSLTTTTARPSVLTLIAASTRSPRCFIRAAIFLPAPRSSDNPITWPRCTGFAAQVFPSLPPKSANAPSAGLYGFVHHLCLMAGKLADRRERKSNANANQTPDYFPGWGRRLIACALLAVIIAPRPQTPTPRSPHR